MRGWRFEKRWVNWLEKCPTVLRAKCGFMNLWWASWYDFLQWSDQWREQIAGFILEEVMKIQEGKELRILPRMLMKWCLVGPMLEKEVWNKEAGRLRKSRGWLPNPSSPLTSSVNASPVTSRRRDSAFLLVPEESMCISFLTWCNSYLYLWHSTNIYCTYYVLSKNNTMTIRESHTYITILLLLLIIIMLNLFTCQASEEIHSLVFWEEKTQVFLF